MKKKLLTFGITALVIILFFTPQIIAVGEDEPPAPISTQIYGIAFINGTIEDPHSAYPLINIINQLLGHKLMIIANFTEGTIIPRFRIGNLRDVTIPSEDFTRAVIYGTLCQWTLEQIEGTNSYLVNGTVYHLIAYLY